MRRYSVEMKKPIPFNAWTKDIKMEDTLDDRGKEAMMKQG